MLMGLSIGRGRLLQSNRSYETFETAQQLFPRKEFKDDDPAKALRLTPSNWTGIGIQCRWFEDRYVNFILEKPKGWELGADHEEEYILAFLFYMVGQAFLKTGTSSIRLSLVTDLLDRSVMKDIDFGGAIYAYLFRGMHEAVRTKSSKGQILGFSIILQYWWFEYARTLNPIQDPLYNGDEVPRIKAWGKNRVEKHYGTVRHSIHLSRQQIEMATANKIVWTPWITSCIMVRERDSFAEDGSMQNYWDACHHTLDLSRRRVVFISPGPLKAWYLGDRAWRQLTGGCYPPPTT
ncbi:hypothetical protein IFM89_023874 [Coptis chinensis]|uniref:Aminotransferase-like plant mobile domain-containing protein n=1 Tax=Coptis chinensis TaxID=261450 RepID=A0A835GZ46_9MAGN|nr:hypothetical protein IFM89_023874 [Coptis chinensis]